MEIGTGLALLSSAFLGTAVVLANVGLRYLHPARGALVSIPSTTLAYWLLAPFLLRGEGWNAAAFAIFAAVGVVFPAVVTLLNFASNRITGPTVAGTVSSTTPLFAVLVAIFVLGEPLTIAAAAGTAAIVLGVIAFTGRGGDAAQAWAILLPLAGAAIRGAAQAAFHRGLALWPEPFVAVLVGYTVSCATIFAASRTLVPEDAAPLNRRGVLWFVSVGACNGAGILAMYAALARTVPARGEVRRARCRGRRPHRRGRRGARPRVKRGARRRYSAYFAGGKSREYCGPAMNALGS
jgi:drug/metabolite transporter (DMT)-like permease